MPSSLTLRLKLNFGSDIAIGPGKADLLEHIREAGSIAAAGRRMGMSYPRAWLLVETMNQCFYEPLVVSERGGQGGGAARLTPVGEEVLARFRRAQQLPELTRAWAGGWLTAVMPAVLSVRCLAMLSMPHS